MKYLCSCCNEEAFYNEKLGIHFCKAHGFSIVPVLEEMASV